MKIHDQFKVLPTEDAMIQTHEIRIPNSDTDTLVLNESWPLETDYDDIPLPYRPERNQRELKRSISTFDGIGIIVGIIVGSGIFSSPGLALYRSGSPGLCLLAWLSSGVLVALTSQCYFELGAMMPSTGGDYDYLLRAYGSQAAFSFAWFNFFISKTGSQAIIATVFGRYLEAAWRNELDLQTVASPQNGESYFAKIAAVLCITFLTVLNCIGIKESTLLQRFLTGLKLLLVLFMFILAMIYLGKDSSTFRSNLSTENAFKGSRGMLDFGSAMIACLWSFDGWAGT